MARGRRPRRVRLWYGDRDPHTALPRAHPRRAVAALGPRRAGERPRGLGRDAGRGGGALLAALRAGRHSPRRRGAHRELRRRAVAALDLPPARREPDRARGPGRARTGGDRPLLAAPRGTRWDARRAAARLGARLPRPPPREPGLPLRRRGRGRARGLAAVSRTAAIVARANGAYAHQPDWYRSFLYTEERDRGLDHVEDLASPGIFRWNLARGEAVLVLAAEGHEHGEDIAALRAAEERRRRRFPSRLHRAADAYLVRRGSGKTIVAGYPWFTDWGRDTFIAMRGLCLATGRLDDARAILLEWAGAVSEGMLPNRFPDRGEAPEFNAVDAALWYVVA